MDARRFSSKAIQLLSPKRVNLLIIFQDFLLLRNEIGRILCRGMLEERRWTRKISVINYKSTILRVHRSVSLKYLRFPNQHIKGNIDSLNDTGYLTKFYTGSHCPRNEPIYHFLLKRCPLSCTFHLKMVSLKKSLFFASLQTALNALSLSFSFLHFVF